MKQSNQQEIIYWLLLFFKDNELFPFGHIFRNSINPFIFRKQLTTNESTHCKNINAWSWAVCSRECSGKQTMWPRLQSRLPWQTSHVVTKLLKTFCLNMVKIIWLDILSNFSAHEHLFLASLLCCISYNSVVIWKPYFTKVKTVMWHQTCHADKISSIFEIMQAVKL